MKVLLLLLGILLIPHLGYSFAISPVTKVLEVEKGGLGYIEVMLFNPYEESLIIKPEIQHKAWLVQKQRIELPAKSRFLLRLPIRPKCEGNYTERVKLIAEKGQFREVNEVSVKLYIRGSRLKRGIAMLIVLGFVLLGLISTVPKYL